MSTFKGATVATLKGDIDGRTTPIFEERLFPLATPGCHIILDMRGVGYLSSAGLRLLLILYREITAMGGRVALAGLQEMVADTMANTGFLEFFAAYPDLPAAFAALNGGGSERDRLQL